MLRLDAFYALHVTFHDIITSLSPLDVKNCLQCDDKYIPGRKPVKISIQHGLQISLVILYKTLI